MHLSIRLGMPLEAQPLALMVSELPPEPDDPHPPPDRGGDDTPDTPPTEPPPVPVQEPPADPEPIGPYVV